MINDEPIALEVEILAKNNKIYKYGFELVKDNIISEWLYEKRVNKFYSIFERENNNITMKTNKIASLSNIKELLKFIKTFDDGIEDINTIPDSVEAVKNNNGIVDIKVTHKGENGKEKALLFYLESNGTRKMFYLFDFFWMH